MGELLKQTFRREDIIAQWDGGEFVIGMYGTNSADGLKRVSELLTTVKQEEFSDRHCTSLQVTFSAGVAQALDGSVELQALYQQADTALHQAKAQGRNRVVIAEV